MFTNKRSKQMFMFCWIYAKNSRVGEKFRAWNPHLPKNIFYLQLKTYSNYLLNYKLNSTNRVCTFLEYNHLFEGIQFFFLFLNQLYNFRFGNKVGSLERMENLTFFIFKEQRQVFFSHKFCKVKLLSTKVQRLQFSLLF